MKSPSYVPNHVVPAHLAHVLPRRREVAVNYPPPPGTRVDRYLAARFPERSRTFFATLARLGQVSANGRPVPPRYRIKEKDVIAFAAAEPPRPRPAPEPIRIEILYEDDLLMAVNKPAGMVVHPAKGHWSGTLVNAVLYHCGALPGEADRPGIVHRLDVDTSGVILVAKDAATLPRLQRQFERRQVRKTYLAVVHGRVAAEADRVDLPLGRSARDRKKVAVRRDAKGRAAESFYRVRERLAGATLVEVVPRTGRMHQIRVHLAAIGHPIVGDKDYGPPVGRDTPPRSGGRAPDLPRQALHAWKLAFTHPRTGERIEIESPLPDDMKALLRRLSGVKIGGRTRRAGAPRARKTPLRGPDFACHPPPRT